MDNIVRLCQIASCKREAAALCYHCQQEICHTHFTQHSSLMLTDVYSLADRINILADNIATFSIAQMRDSLVEQLQQWRDENINLLQNMFTQKQVELNTKIDQLDAILSRMKTEKQKEISQIKKKISEMINAGEATFDQVNLLSKSIDKIAFEVDKLESSTIRIETQPTNFDTCHIISIEQVSHIQPEDISISVSKLHVDNYVRHSDKTTNHPHSSTSQSMVTVKEGRQTSSVPISGSLTTPHSLQILYSRPTFLPPTSVPSSSPPSFLSPQMPVPLATSRHRPSEPIYHQRSSFASLPYPTDQPFSDMSMPAYPTQQPSSNILTPPYPGHQSSFDMLMPAYSTHQRSSDILTPPPSTQQPLSDILTPPYPTHQSSSDMLMPTYPIHQPLSDILTSPHSTHQPSSDVLMSPYPTHQSSSDMSMPSHPTQQLSSNTLTPPYPTHPSFFDMLTPVHSTHQLLPDILTPPYPTDRTSPNISMPSYLPLNHGHQHFDS